MKTLLGTVVVALFFAQQTPAVNPQLDVECVAESVQDGFRLRLSGKTTYPEGTILDTAVSRRRLFDVESSIYPPNELAERIAVKEGGKIDSTMNVPGNFFLPGRYTLRVGYDPESQIERVKKSLAAKGMKSESRSDGRDIVLRDVERTVKLLQDDLKDFQSIVSSIDKANTLFKKVLAQAVRQKEDMEPLLKHLADVERIRRRSENHTYIVFAYSQVDLFFGFIPRITLSGETAKPPHTLEEEKAMEKTNLKLLEEKKENEVIKPNDPIVPLVQIAEKIRTYFIAEFTSEIVMECDIMLTELRKEVKSRESWERQKKWIEQELDRLSKIAGEFERSTFGGEIASDFSIDGLPIVKKALESVAGAVAVAQKKIDREGKIEKECKEIVELHSQYEKIKEGLKKSAEERITRLLKTHQPLKKQGVVEKEND